MSKKIYSEIERKMLESNPNVKSVSEKSVTYMPEFKIEAVLSNIERFKTPAQIFIDAGFNIEVLGTQKPNECLKRWRRIYNQKGIDGLLMENRGANSTGRPSSKELTAEEKLKRMEAKLKRLEKENELLKKLEPLERGVMESASKKYIFIKDIMSEISKSRKIHERNLFSVKYLCELVGVSRSGYYKWLKTSERRRIRVENEFEDYKAIKRIFDNEQGKAGWRTIKMALETDGIFINHKKIIRIMKKYGLRCKVRQLNPYKHLRKAQMEHRTFPNLLNRKFNQPEPLKVFGTDITYLKSDYGLKSYLSVILDISSGEIVSYKLTKKLSLELSVDLVSEFLKLPQVKSREIMIHSDQGIHYTCAAYTELLSSQGIVQSMSRRGNCIDNAPVESFFGHLKDELDYHSVENFDILVERVKNHIYKYNHLRKQWTKKKMAPVDYRNHLMAA